MEICKLNNQNTDSKNGGTNEKMVSILVVDDDRYCLSIVASLLKKGNYHVLTAKDPLDALFILRTRAIKFDLVVSDVHMPELDGFELQRRIQQEFQLPVVLMSADVNASNLCDGSQNGTSFFVLKPISTKDLKSIWDFGNQWKKKLAKGKIIISDYGYDNDNKDDIGNKIYEKNSKRKLQIINDNNHDDIKIIAMKGKSLATKKNKVVWTPYLHGKFVEAMQHLGHERSVPRNILHVMNEPALKRENVASHLQKFKEYQRKWSDAEHDNNHKTGKMWSSSFLSHEALLGYGQSKLLTNPGFPPSGLTSGTYSSQMYQPEAPKFPSSDNIFSGFNSAQTLAPIHMNHNGFSKQIQPSNCYIGSGKEVYNTSVSQSNFASPTFDTGVPEQQYESADLSNVFLNGSSYQSTDKSNFASPTFDNVIPEQQYEPADLSNIFLYGNTYQSTDENKNQDYYVGNNFGDAFLVNEDMPNADKANTNLNQQENGEEVNWASWGSNNTTKVEELVFWDEKNPSEEVNKADNNNTTKVEDLVCWDEKNTSEKNGEVNGASSGSNNTTNVEELVFWDKENPSEKQDNGGMVNSADNTGTSNVEPEGNQTSNDDQQAIREDFWKYLLFDFDGGDNYF